MIFRFTTAKIHYFGKLKTVLVINDLIVIETKGPPEWDNPLMFKHSELGVGYTFREAIRKAVEYIKKGEDYLLHEIVYKDKEKKIIKYLNDKRFVKQDIPIEKLITFVESGFKGGEIIINKEGKYEVNI